MQQGNEIKRPGEEHRARGSGIRQISAGLPTELAALQAFHAGDDLGIAAITAGAGIDIGERCGLADQSDSPF